MEFFKRAKVFRLKCSSQSKYLIAHKDEETIKQSRDKYSKNAQWTYELVEGKPNVIRLRSSCSWRYLAAAEDPFLLGMTGKNVVQTISSGTTIEWEVIKQGAYIKLKSYCGTILRANRGPPPWRNSVTHDEPHHWTATQNMSMWIVDIIVIDYEASSKMVNHDSTASLEKANYGWPQDMCYSTKPTFSGHADSSNNGININKANGTNSSSNYPPQSTLTHPQPFEVIKAKQTLEQLQTTDFNTILGSGQAKKLEKAVESLITNSKSSSKLIINIQEQIKSMKNSHESACQDLSGFSTFNTRRLEAKDELKKFATKAHELEKVGVEISKRVLDAKVKREELLKQLQEAENDIKEVEKCKEDNVVKVDEIILSIEKKSEMLKEMEIKKMSWRVKKNEALGMLESVEKDWGMVKNIFP